MKNTPFEQLYLLALPFAAALSCFGGISVGMLRHTGAIWIATLFVGVLLLLSQVLSRGIDRIIFPWIWWLPFYLYLFASLLWSDLRLQNFQLAMQMAVYPIVGMVAAMAIRKQEDLGPLNWLYFGATLFIGLVCCYFMFGPGAAIPNARPRQLHRLCRKTCRHYAHDRRCDFPSPIPKDAAHRLCRLALGLDLLHPFRRAHGDTRAHSPLDCPPSPSQLDHTICGPRTCRPNHPGGFQHAHYPRSIL